MDWEDKQGKLKEIEIIDTKHNDYVIFILYVSYYTSFDSKIALK